MTPPKKMTETEKLVADLYKQIEDLKEEAEQKRIEAWIKGFRLGKVAGGGK